jgi:hypothetical protein
MGKFGFLAMTALILAGFGGWVAATGQARVNGGGPTGGVQIDTMEIMKASQALPNERFVDYSLIYP